MFLRNTLISIVNLFNNFLILNMTLLTKSLALFVLFTTFQATFAATSELTNDDINDNCAVLMGKEKKQAFSQFLEKTKKAALANDKKSAEIYMGVTNNRFVCFEEAIEGGDKQWTMQIKDGSGITKTQESMPVSLKGNRAALEALNDSIEAAKLYGNYLAYSYVLAAEKIYQYRTDQSEKIQEAYGFATFGDFFYCQHKALTTEKNAWKYRCEGAHQLVAKFVPLLPENIRSQLDASSRLEAEKSYQKFAGSK